MKEEKLSEKDEEILQEILTTIESRIRSGNYKGGISSREVDFTLYYLFKYER